MVLTFVNSLLSIRCKDGLRGQGTLIRKLRLPFHPQNPKGWTWRKQGHWGRLYCPHADRDGCQVGVWSTPKNPEDHAKQVVRAIERCPRGKEDENGKV